MFALSFYAADLYGTWELVWSNVELFRSSPFFQSVGAAMPNRDAAEFFFLAHSLQTGLVSKIGKIEQVIMPRALPQEGKWCRSYESA